MKKYYYKLVFRLVSPLALSNGIGIKTDADVLLNSFGKPFIPASAIAGAMSEGLSENIRKELFGSIEQGGIQNSYIITYDANTKDDFNLSVRDGVGLDENKIAKDGAKYDFEVVEPNIYFTTFLEFSDNEEADRLSNKKEDATQLIEKIYSLKMGAKTTRGYGVLQLQELYKKVFVLSKEKDNDTYNAELNKTWLDFDLFADLAFEENDKLPIAQAPSYKKYSRLEIALKIIGSPVVRKYTTNVSLSKTSPEPDFENLTIKNRENSDRTPVIPGTSWAGAFRSHIQKNAKKLGFLSNEFFGNPFDNAFGNVNANDKNTENVNAIKSKITFSESQIVNSTPHISTRTAIDRFSGGAVENSLYTQRIWYGGTTNLCIEFDNEIDNTIKELLACAIMDLDVGILSIGGGTSVGHGIFEVKSICLNGVEIKDFNPQSLTKM